MVKDVIEGIKETEAKAAGIVEDARKKRGELVAEARDAARKTIEEAKTQGGDRVKQALEAARQEAERRVETIAREETAERERVRQAAADNVSKAVDLVIERVLK